MKFTPALALAGYDGLYTNKSGKVREGSALFFRRSRFALLAHRDLNLRDFFPKALPSGGRASGAQPRQKSSDQNGSTG